MPLADTRSINADRRFEFARQLAERGDHLAAADLLRQAIELAPQWAEAHFSLGGALMQLGQTDEAVSAFRDYLALDATDSLGALPKLAQLGAAPVTAELPPAYVERLFDQYAARFEKSLLDGLGYNAPHQIRAALETRFPGRRFQRALDLGCGTGLMGLAVRGSVDILEGVDLSAQMLAEAARKNIYDNLQRADLLRALAEKPSTYDLILAADVLVYIGDLKPVTAATFNALAPGGAFAFTVQTADTPGYSLGTDQRFSHHETYIASVMTGFTGVGLIRGSFRRERNDDVPGLMVVAEKPV